MIIQEGSVCIGLGGRHHRLEKEVGKGGEGRVYKLCGEDLVGKIYKNPDPDVEKKLRYMVAHPIDNLLDSSGRTILALAWPKDILYDDQGNFAGYAMPFIQDAVEICAVAQGCIIPKAKAMFPDHNWLFNLQLAINLSRAVAYLHSRNCIVGDLNCKNIMVSPDGLITLLDNDSFDLVDAVSGAHFRCCAGTQDYLAPELQGRNLRSPSAIFSVHSDDFALAIHIFQLLMNNFHPFTGKNLVVIQDSTATNQRLEHLVNGKCPFLRSYPDLTVPIGAPLLTDMVTPQLIQDFARTFGYDAGSISERMNQRTTAGQWVTDLQQLMNQFYTPGLAYQCSRDPKHFYLRQFQRCGLCAAQARLENFRSSHTPPKPAATPRPAPIPTPKPTPSPKPTPTPSSSGSFGWILVVLAVFALFYFFGYRSAGNKSTSSTTRTTTSTSSTTAQRSTHTHNWVPATYTRPEYCSTCFQERGYVKGYVGNLSGTWEDISIEGWNCNMIHLEKAIYGMRKMTFNLTVEMKAGARCENWKCYVWNGNKWINMGTLTISGGNGSGTRTFYGDGTENIEWIAVVPTARGSYSYTQYLYLTDVQQN